MITITSIISEIQIHLLISHFDLAIPPLEEQDQIVTVLDIESKKMDYLISKAESAIELMKERRTALISAAVTGKIDVRDWEPPKDETG